MDNHIVESTPTWPFILVIVLLVMTLAWFVWNFWQLKKSQKSSMNNAQKILKLQKILKENDKAFEKLNPIVEHSLILRDGMDDVAAKPTTKERLEALHALMEKAVVWGEKRPIEDGKKLLKTVFKDAEKVIDEAEEAMSVIRLLQQKIQQFYSLLRTVDLDEATECQIRTDFLALSMMMMDVLQSICSPFSNSEEQGVNVKLLKEQITLEDAVKKTNPVTFLDIETSPWAQKLFKSLEKWAGPSSHPLIERRPYLLRGLRMEFNK